MQDLYGRTAYVRVSLCKILFFYHFLLFFEPWDLSKDPCARTFRNLPDGTHTHKDPYKIFLFKTLFNDLLTRAPQEPAGSLKENSCKDLWKMICLQKDLLKDLRIRKL